MGSGRSVSVNRLSSNITDGFSVIAEVKGMISRLSYSDEAMVQLASIIADSIVRLQFLKEGEDQKSAAVEVLADKTFDDFHDHVGLFEDLVRTFRNKVPRNIKQVNLSRLYHTAANTLTQYLIKQPQTLNVETRRSSNKKEGKSSKEEDSILPIRQNYYGDSWMKGEIYRLNAYEKLSSGDLQKVILLQKIAEEIENLGERIKYKYKGIRDESDQMIDFLNRGFGPHQETLLSMKEDMSDNQVQVIAKIAREACHLYEESFFMLLVYLTRSMYRLQKQGMSVVQIERRLSETLKSIQRLYPQGNRLGDGQLQAEKILRDEQVSGSYRYKPYDLSIRDKPKQVKDLVTRYARVASERVQQFEKLVFDTCLKRCIAHKISQRYNPTSPNPKDMSRILQEMLLQGAQISKATCSSLEDTLEYEDKLFEKVLNDTLDKLDSVEFNIMDMVRGKCTFAQVHEISEAVQSIKNFVRERPQTYRIIKIQSRFNNPVPISDVIIHLLIGEEIVTELRLVYQSNSGADKFASKLDGLFRKSIFSTVKIVHNHFEENREKFSQMVQRALPLKVDGGVPRVAANNQAVCKYFGISGEQLTTFDEVFNYTWRQRSEDMADLNDATVSLCTDEENQNLIRPIFLKKVGEWQTEIGQIINQVLNESDNSPLLKSVLVENFLRDFNPAHHMRHIYQFFTLFQQDPKRQEKNYIQSYIEHRYGIQNIGKYALQTARSYYQFKQIESIECRLDEMQVKTGTCPLYIDLVYGSHSPQTARMLIRRLQFLSKINALSSFQRCYEILLMIKQRVSFQEVQKQYLGLQLLTAHQYLTHYQEENKNSSVFLNKLKKQLLSESMFEEALQCEFLLAEVRFSTGRQAQYDEQYHKIAQLAAAQSISLDGQLIAESEWRVGMKILQMNGDRGRSDSARAALVTHIIKAISYFIRQYHAEELFQKLRQVWTLLKDHKIDPPKFEPNAHVMRFVLSDQLTDEQLDILVRPQWPALATLGLPRNRIGDRGCEFFTESRWPGLRQLSLGYNHIELKGCRALSQAYWPKLTSLQMEFNKIGDRGCEFLVTAKWPLLTSLLLSGNDIGDEGCKVLSEGNWRHLKTLWLRSNRVEMKGLKALGKGRWQKLTDLDLRNNKTLYLVASKEEIQEQSSLLFTQRNIQVQF